MLTNINTDFDRKTQDELISIISQVENSNIQPISNDFAVRVKLKDDSTFAFAPRRFSQSERVEIRKITDDLLKRGIIKVSTSPYCTHRFGSQEKWTFMVMYRSTSA